MSCEVETEAGTFIRCIADDYSRLFRDPGGPSHNAGWEVLMDGVEPMRNWPIQSISAPTAVGLQTESTAILIHIAQSGHAPRKG